MTSIHKNLALIKANMPKHVTLVAVSKTKPMEDIQSAYDAGQRIFGENKVQEMVEKHQDLPKDIQWHMIGHLQRNKIKYMASFVDLIHGIDTLKTLKEVNKQAEKNNRKIDCLLQVKIAEEESKFGFSMEEIEQLLHSEELKNMKFINIKGLMGMASFTKNVEQVKEEFQTLSNLFNNLKEIASNNIYLDVLSMGMSGDYPIAIESGSTMIRVGSAIFGNRNYKN